MVYEGAGLHLVKKKGKHELHKAIGYSGGKRKITYLEVIRRPHHSTNIVRDISIKAAQGKFGVNIKHPSRRKTSSNYISKYFGM